MYNIGDLIIYSSHGICRIDDICEQTYSGITRTYYVIHPIEDNSLTINTPIDSAQIIIQNLMERDEAEEIMQTFKQPGMGWIEKNHDRTRIYSDMIKTGDRKEIAKIIHTLLRKKHVAESNGKKLGENDRQLLQLTQNILFKELSLALETTYDHIVEKVNELLDIKSDTLPEELHLKTI